MASAWAQLSKEDQAAFSAQGYTKKSYNDQYGKGGESAPSAPTSSSSSSSASNPSAQDLINKYTPNAGAAADASKDSDPLNTKYSDMSDSYKENTAKADHKEAKQKAEQYKNTKYSEIQDEEYKALVDKSTHKDNRKTSDTYTNDRLDSYNVDSLDDFDITNTGRGRKEGENRLSVTELNKLAEAGHSKEDIANRATTGEWSDAKKGSKAQALVR